MNNHNSQITKYNAAITNRSDKKADAKNTEPKPRHVAIRATGWVARNTGLFVWDCLRSVVTSEPRKSPAPAKPDMSPAHIVHELRITHTHIHHKGSDLSTDNHKDAEIIEGELADNQAILDSGVRQSYKRQQNLGSITTSDVEIPEFLLDANIYGGKYKPGVSPDISETVASQAITMTHHIETNSQQMAEQPMPNRTKGTIFISPHLAL